MSQFRGVWANVCLGEVFAAGLTIIALILTQFTSWSSLVEWGFVLTTATLGFGASLQLRRSYNRDIRAKLARAAASISKLVDVPIVCFGHSHRAQIQRQPHSHRSFYVNTGSFLAHGHETHPIDGPCNCTQSFVIISHPDGFALPRPQLYGWCHVNRKKHPWKQRSAQSPVPDSVPV